MRRFWVTSIFIQIVLACILLAPAAAQAQAPVIYDSYDVDLTLNMDGSFDVGVRQLIEFDDEFTRAFFTIPRDYVASVDDIEVYEAPVLADGRALWDTNRLTPVDLEVEEAGDEWTLNWTYARTAPGDRRAFLIRYRALGGVWVYPDRDILRWDAVHADRSGVPVRDSSVTVHLPLAIPVESIAYSAAGPPVETARGRDDAGHQIRWRSLDELPDGEPFHVAVEFPHGLVNAELQPWQRESDREDLRVSLDAFDVTLRVEQDGALRVREEMQVTPSAGMMYDAFRSTRLLYLDDVRGVQVWQDGAPLRESADPCDGCYTVSREPRLPGWAAYQDRAGAVVITPEVAGVVNVDWSFPGVSPGQSTTFALEYTVDGAIRVGEEDQRITWQVTPSYDIPIDRTQLRIVLPPGLANDAVQVSGSAPQGAPRLQADGSLLLQHDGPVSPGADWTVEIVLPAAATAATSARWQQELETALAAEQAAAVARARQQLALRVTGLAAAVAALLGGILAWFRWGRRRVKEQLGGYVSEPPSALSPGIVAYWVDRRASQKGVMASLFHLAAMDCIAVDLDGEMALTRTRQEPLKPFQSLARSGGGSVEVDRHLAFLFNNVLTPNLPLGQPVPLAQIAAALQGHLPELYAAMGQDVQQYLLRTPRQPRDLGRLVPFLMVGWFLFIVTLMRQTGGLGLGFGSLPSWVIGSFLVLVTAMIALNLVGGWRRNDLGEREAQRWIRFRNYLSDLQRYGDLAAAQAILDRHFAYAVALGVETAVLNQVTGLGGVQPPWMAARPTSSTGSQPDTAPPGSSQPRPTRLRGWPFLRPAAGTGGERPTLAATSRQWGASLSSASQEMGRLLAAGAGDSAATRVTLNSPLQSRAMSWEAGTPVNRILDDILRQSLADTRQVQAQRQAAARTAPSSGGSSSGGSSWRSSSGSRSSGGFGSRSSSRSSSSSSSRRSGGGGRSGFG